MWSCVFSQRKVPDQDVAQGSYIALPLTLLLLLAAYNHEKVRKKKTVLLITLLIFIGTYTYFFRDFLKGSV